MELFSYVISPNETLYKGINEPVFDINYKGITWVTKNHFTAEAYGRYCHSVKNAKPLRLINIMSKAFQDYLLETLNDMYAHLPFNISYDKKMPYLVPIGLPDYKTQIAYLKKHFTDPAIQKVDPQNVRHFEEYGGLVNYTNRCSIESLDKQLIGLVKRLLVQYKFDGYIAPYQWPSSIHGLFHDEICLFDLSECNLVYNTHYQIVRAGGGSTGQIVSTGQIMTNDTRTENEMAIFTMKAMGYDGPHKYKKNGAIVERSYEWIKAYNRKIKH